VLNGTVPWCTDCDRYLAPPTVRTDGTCPTCGRPVDVAAPAQSAHTPASPARSDTLPPVPWHFKLMLCALAVYLGYRFMQMGEWLLHRL
jgi:rRNA maturation protein Nop10